MIKVVSYHKVEANIVTSFVDVRFLGILVYRKTKSVPVKIDYAIYW
jgi:hypothetical protein